ncbi:hypothetical protein ASD80_10010 [Devosia sp. Root635]|nr:hypothetical protein ASD80_10010 [Devosia sp. Root635]
MGSLATLIIPPAMASSLMQELPQAPMTAKERADFHLAEFARAMDELKPADAHSWGATIGGDGTGRAWSKRHAIFRLPDPEIEQRLKRPFLIDRMVSLGETP